jgi:predicted O-methyltransferase YrrM
MTAMKQIDHQCSLNDQKIQKVLNRIYHEAKGERFRMGCHLLRDAITRHTLTLEEHVRRLKTMYLPLSRERGTFAYLIARAIRAKRIVEFGTAFGVSTIYLAAAVKDNGGGLVIGSELDEDKIVKAWENLNEAGLTDYVAFMNDPQNRFQSLTIPFQDGLEYSVRI